MAIPTLLANFDGNLAARDRSGVTALTSSGPVRYTPGLGPASQAVICEEGTTNYNRNPLFDPAGATWSATRCTIDQDAAVTRDGTPSGVMEITSLDGAAYTYLDTNPATAAPGDVWVHRAYARGSVAGLEAIVGCDALDNTGMIISMIRSSAVVVTNLDGAWTELRITTSALPAGTDRVRPIVVLQGASRQVGDKLWVVQPQPEKKSYATSFCPQFDDSGNLLPGFTWSSAAHASASTRAESYIDAGTNVGRISPKHGSIAVRFRPIGMTSGSSALVRVGSFGTGDFIYLYKDPAQRISFYTIQDGNPRRTVDNIANPAVIGERITAIADWSLTEVGLHVEGGSRISTPRVDTVAANMIGSPFLYIGGTAPPNAEIDGVICFDRPLTDTERATLINTESWQWNTLFPRLGGILRVGAQEPIGIMRVGGGELA